MCKYVSRYEEKYIVVDYNPDVIETLERQHIHHVYGDARQTMSCLKNWLSARLR
ncbi:NAD-binding protein [Candidatus Saccharibacteria bacterium]|nr:MAG: NAD-binding protein [Candidatus Saccharibacteria bacterium]